MKAIERARSIGRHVRDRVSLAAALVGKDIACTRRQREGGGVLIMVAAMLVVLIGFTALAVDVGWLMLNRRRLQGATDAAALAAAWSPGRATAIAGESLSANGFSAAALTAATTGQYQEDPSLPAAQRFVAGGANPDAVRVQATTTAPLFFMRALVPRDSATISTTATAARIDEAAFTAGTGLVSLNGGIANAILGKMLGTTVNLNAVQYQGLLNTDINAADFLGAMATNLKLSAGTYSQVLASNVTVGQVVSGEIAALQGEGVGSAGLDALDGLQTLQTQLGDGGNFTLGSLVGIGIAQGQQVGSAAPGTAATGSLNLYQLVSGAAQLANGANAVAVNGALDLPGIATADLYMTMIEPAQSSEPNNAMGPIGTTVHTAQIRLLLNVHLLSALSILGKSAAITVPIYLELASGNATLTAVNCGSQPATDTTVTIAAQPSVANLYIAQVNQSLMSNFTEPVSVSTPATLVNLLGLVSVTAKATVALGSASPTDLNFTEQQMTAVPPQSQTVASTGMSQDLVDTLGQSLQLQVKALGLPLLPGIAQQITTALTTQLSPVFASLDQLIDPVLATLGIQLGTITVTATGAQCGVPVLVL